MKKKYILILEFKTEISEHLQNEDKEKAKKLGGLLKELLRNDQAILDIYKLWLFADFIDGNQVFEMEKNLLKKTTEIELIRPVLDCLPEAKRKHFAKVLEMDRESINRYFASVFAQFGQLKVTKANFIENGK